MKQKLRAKLFLDLLKTIWSPQVYALPKPQTLRQIKLRYKEAITPKDFFCSCRACMAQRAALDIWDLVEEGQNWGTFDWDDRLRRELDSVCKHYPESLQQTKAKGKATIYSLSGV